MTLTPRSLPQFPVATGERWLVKFRQPTRVERRADIALRNTAYRQKRAHLHALTTLVRPDGAIASQVCVPVWTV